MQTRHMSAFGVRLVAVVALAGAAQAAVAGELVWKRSTDWVPGVSTGSAANNPSSAHGVPSWQYEWAQGGAMGSSNPWYANPGTLMTWNEEWWETGAGAWSRGPNVNPPIRNDRMIHTLHESVYDAAPVVRWLNPFGAQGTLDISGSLRVVWAGNHPLPLTGHPVDLDMVIAKQNATQTQTTVLWANGVHAPSGTPSPISKPNPFPSVGDMLVFHVNLEDIALNPGDSIILTHRGRSMLAPHGGWIGVHDNLSFTAIPSPGALALLGAAGLVAARRRRAKN